MAAATYTVQAYLDAAKPIPAGTTVYIVDTAANIAALSAADLAGMGANKVVSINATDNALSLTLEQIDALGTVKLSGDDTIALLDTDVNLAGLTSDKITSLNAKGVDVIAATDKTLQISRDVASAIASTSMRFDADDTVTVSDNGKLDLTPTQIAALSLKGVDLIDLTGGFPFDPSVTIDQAIALSKSEIEFVPGNTVRLDVSDSEMSKLTPAVLETLSAKQIDTLDSSAGAFSLTLAQYSALNGLSLASDDLVTLKLSLMDLALLKDSQIADFATNNVDEVAFSASRQTLLSLSADSLASLIARGVTVVDATENVLALNLAQYNALSAMNFTPEDTVTVSVRLSEVNALTQGDVTNIHNKRVDKVILTETGKVLGALTVEQISALVDKNIDTLDATDNKLTLTSTQYNTLGSGRLTSSDVVTVVASEDFNAHEKTIDNLILTGNALWGSGNELANTITGNAKNNVLSGFDGNDVLIGGKGKDAFFFEASLNKKTNVDVIKDFSVADDSIWLSSSIFTKLPASSNSSPTKLSAKNFALGKAADKNDYVIYDGKKGYVSYDADGSGTGAAILFAKVTPGLKLTYADFFVTDFLIP